MQYHAEKGTFITWSGGAVTPLGNDVKVSSDTPVYWTPWTSAGTEILDGDTVTITIIQKNEILTETVLPITHNGDSWYSIGEGVTPSKPQEPVPPLKKAPRLEISFIEDGLSEQRIQAAQLTTSWYVVDENGDGHGYESDSPHPLQLRDYDDITLKMNKTNGEIVLQFTDDYPLQSVSIQRWDAEYAVGSQDITNALDKTESVEVNGNVIHIITDGHDYIYEVYAKWEQGSSWYAFRIDSK